MSDQPPEETVWAISFDDGTTVRLVDLPIATLEEIAAAHSMSWLGLIDFPSTRAAALHSLVEACAKHAGVAVPPAPQTGRDALALSRLLDRVPDDLPTRWEGDEGRAVPPTGGPTTD